MSLSPLSTTLLGLALAAVLCACGSDAIPAQDTDDDQTIIPHLATVETTVTPESIGTGDSTTVSCAGKDQHGDPFATDLPLEFEVFDANDQTPQGVSINGSQVTAEFAGVVRVRCFYPGTPYIEDGSPISLTIQPGGAATIKTTILKTEIQAGDKIGVACSVRDGLDNITVGETELLVSPTTGTTVTAGKTIRFTRTGVFDVTCALTDGSLAGNTVQVTVSPAELDSLETILSVSTIRPTEEVTVSCPGRDRYGNDVMLDKVITLPVEGIDALDGDRLRLTGTLAGAYPITCVPKEAFVSADRNPAELTVTPGDPAAIHMDLNPDRTVYALGARPRVTARLNDAWGNEVADVSAVSVEARFGNALRETVAGGERVTLDEEGSWNLSTRTGPPSNLSATRTVLVDASAPTIDITYPERGSMVTTSGGPFTIRGVITDATGGLESISFNGIPREVTYGANRYDVEIPISPEHGLNTFRLEATDVQGQTVQIAQSFILAPGWKSASQSFPAGIVAHLTRAFIDDGNRHGSPNDLATIMERVVQNLDIAAYIPSPVVQNAGYDVFLRNVDYDPPTLTLTPSRDNLLLHMDILSLSIDVDAQGFIDVSGVVSASAVRVDVQLGLTIQGGEPKVTAQTVSVVIENLDIDVHWSINWLIDLFTDTIQESIINSFEDVLRAEIPPVVADALGSLTLDETFAVPGFLPGQMPLNVRLQAGTNNGRIAEVGLDVELSTKVTAAKKVQWYTPGSMMRGGCFDTDLGMPAWDSSKKLTMALSLDVINQVLHAVWQGGALELSLGADAFGDADLSQYGVSDLSVDLSARLPPILTDCRDGILRIQIGELHVDADLKLNGQPLSIDMIVAFETTVDVSVDDAGSISLALGDIAPEDIVIDITRVGSEFFTEEDEAVLVTLLREQLLTRMLADFGGQGLADFPLPEFDLGGLDPALGGLVISLGDIVLDRDKGYLLLQGNP